MKDSIKVDRDAYFLRLSPPYQIAGYLTRQGKDINTGVVISIHNTWRNSAIPAISIKAIKSLEVLE
ncbi:hypothetical protein COU57_01500 [Candidatus Pacearchaeota archaeon CG10_big_fil_rev_8_21_14_0_10_32_14]|nr:MAG: hypothetical protein COU57_01500 [Candidatus Pacearchaeota archaeon CG10_big_fil_rev_8_21_14_0_10_32_14]